MINSEREQRPERGIDYIAVVNLGDGVYLAHPNPRYRDIDMESEGNPEKVIQEVWEWKRKSYKCHLEGTPIIGLQYENGRHIPESVQRKFENAFGKEFQVKRPEEL